MVGNRLGSSVSYAFNDRNNVENDMAINTKDTRECEQQNDAS